MRSGPSAGSSTKKFVSCAVAVAVLCLALLAGAQPAGAATYTVTVTADTNDGVCNSHCSLREALVAADATPGLDTVVIPAGTYLPSTYGFWSASDDVILVGAGAGATTLEMMGIPYCTILSTSASATFQDLSLKGLDCPLSYQWCVDWGVAVKGSGTGTLRFDNVTATDVTGLAYAGTSTWEFPAVQVDNVTVNQASGEHLGVLVADQGGSVRVTNSTFNNVQWALSVRSGGSAALDRVTINAGWTTMDPGCPPLGANITNAGGGLTIDRTTIAGGIYDHAIRSEAGQTTITRSLLQPGYQARNQMAVTGGTVTVDNSTITNGVAWGGPDISVSGGSLTLRRSTVSHNADVVIDRSGSGVVNLEGSIISDNGGANCTGFVTSLGYNLDDDNTCGLNVIGDQVSVNPLLGPLANNGGWTQTRVPSVMSPAVNVIPSSVLPLCSGTDQRGVTRPKQGSCEKGAVERTWWIGYVDPAVALPPSPLLSGDPGITIDQFGVAKVSLAGGALEVDGITYSMNAEVSRLLIFPIGIGHLAVSGGGQERSLIYFGSIASDGKGGASLQGLGLSLVPLQVVPVKMTLTADPT